MSGSAKSSQHKRPISSLTYEAISAPTTVQEPQLSLSFGDAPPRLDVHPIIKWAGGKWQLLPQLQALFPPLATVHQYFEPFLGGGAVFFFLQHPHSHLSDSNNELINMYQVVRDSLPALIDALSQHVNTPEHFYQVRSLRPNEMDEIHRAARFIYLNKTCFNGLYRVNRSGQFNVPYGRYTNPTICDVQNLQAASEALRSATLQVMDYETALSNTGQGDFVYFDPPYQPISKTSSFTSYTDVPFGESEQIRLANFCMKLHLHGCRFMLSNSDTPLIRSLYGDAPFNLHTVTAKRAISSKATTRGPISEVVILNYDPTSGELHDTKQVNAERYSMGTIHSRKKSHTGRKKHTG